MDITPLLKENAPLIERYGNGGFVIAGTRHEGHVFVTTKSVSPSPDFSAETLAPLLDVDTPPELVLIGTGEQMQMLAPDIKKALEARQIGYDVMDTGAACRTFNILLAEERRVAALLLAI